MATKIQYTHPPVTEAVIELRFTNLLDSKHLKKPLSKFRNPYPLCSDINDTHINVDIDAKSAEFREHVTGYRFSTEDQADVLILTNRSFVVSRLAPYLGWEIFRERAKKDWDTWSHTIGNPAIGRIGVRYINRIDIPMQPNENLRIDDYLLCYPQIPEGKFLPMSQYVMQVLMPVGDEFQVLINTTTVPSPLVNHISLIFDFDISKEQNLPRKQEKIWELIDKIREHRNYVFESCITDKARELFSK